MTGAVGVSVQPAVVEGGGPGGGPAREETPVSVEYSDCNTESCPQGQEEKHFWMQ